MGAFHEAGHDANEVAAHGAADAAIVHFEDFFVRAHDQVVVDADLAKLIDDNRVFLAVRFGQNTVEERGFAGAEIAGKDGDGNLGGHGVVFSFWF